jgi:hypothetical protein
MVCLTVPVAQALLYRVESWDSYQLMQFNPSERNLFFYITTAELCKDTKYLHLSWKSKHLIVFFNGYFVANILQMWKGLRSRAALKVR